MNLLSISSDKKIFAPKSSVRKRMEDQSSVASSLTIIVFSLERDGLEEFEVGNLKVIPTNSRSKFLYSLDAYKKARNLSFDLITTQDPFESGLAGYLLKRKSSKPLLVQCHTDFLSPEFKKEGILNFIRYCISLFIIPRADSVRAVSKRVKDSILKRFESCTNIEVLPVFREFGRPEEGVFPNLHKKYPQFGFIILSVSRLEKEKNIDLLIESFSSALYMMDDAGLVIVGSGSEKSKLEKKVANLGLVEKIKFEGWQDNLLGYYNSADLFVSTSNYEGYGLVFLEAAYYGCPVLSTDVGIMNDVFKDNESALVCPVKDKECLGNKMAEMRRFGDVRKRIREAGGRSARNAMWTKENYLLRLKKIWRKSL